MPGINTILVVDDEANLRQTMTAILQRAGYQVSSAADAQQARQFLHAGAYGLVFLDLKMPGIDGMTLLPEFRLQYPDMPILILTAHATIESAIKAVREGARDYLIKPIDPDQLLKRVKEILLEQQQPQRRRELVSQIQELLGELHQIDGTNPVSLSPAADQVRDPARFLRLGSLTLDMHTQCVLVNNQEINIPPSSFDYLMVMVRHSPHPVQFETLVKEAQGYTLSRSEAREMARGHIHELRKAIEPDSTHPHLIITVRDVGYRLVT
jgi:DNA-binding response OmpR family regulator